MSVQKAYGVRRGSDSIPVSQRARAVAGKIFVAKFYFNNITPLDFLTRLKFSIIYSDKDKKSVTS